MDMVGGSKHWESSRHDGYKPWEGNRHSNSIILSRSRLKSHQDLRSNSHQELKHAASIWKMAGKAGSPRFSMGSPKVPSQHQGGYNECGCSDKGPTSWSRNIQVQNILTDRGVLFDPAPRSRAHLSTVVTISTLQISGNRWNWQDHPSSLKKTG